MVYFSSDYMVGAHPEVLEALVATNQEHTPGYGADQFTAQAEQLILEACQLTGTDTTPRGKVYLLEGGTQTNLIVIDRLLDRNDGVLSADTAHINVHEAGAIEACGHKVLALPSNDGKLTADQVDRYLTEFYSDETHEHMVRPAMVYITFPTELGTLYTRQQLSELYQVCRRWQIPLYIDGARLAYGLASPANDLTLPDIVALSDLFYIGGTKCGALFGEALVTRRPELLPRFFSLMKLRGGVLAKGRLLGVQFKALFENNLYQRIGQHAIQMAMMLKQGVVERGYTLYMDSPTNQQFVMLPNDKIEALRPEVSFELWGPPGERETPVRFVTDWSTTPDAVRTLLTLL